jgi:hypothetical protein
MKKDWHLVAKKRWPKAEWIEGIGQYALLAWCRVLSITLWDTLEIAERAKKGIDETGCGGECCNKHEIVDLERK